MVVVPDKARFMTAGWFFKLEEIIQAVVNDTDPKRLPASFVLMEGFTNAPPVDFLPSGHILGHRTSIEGSRVKLQLGAPATLGGDLQVLMPFTFFQRHVLTQGGSALDEAIGESVRAGETTISGDASLAGIDWNDVHNRMIECTEMGKWAI
jgi:hypothetical protein